MLNCERMRKLTIFSLMRHSGGRWEWETSFKNSLAIKAFVLSLVFLDSWLFFFHLAIFFVGWQKLFFCESSLKASKWFHSFPLDAISEYSSLALNGGGGVCDERKKALERRKNFCSRWYIFSNKREKNKEEKWQWMMHEENKILYLKAIVTLNISWEFFYHRVHSSPFKCLTLLKSLCGFYLLTVFNKKKTIPRSIK